MLAKIKEDGGDISGTYYFKTQYNYFYSFPQGFIKACDCTLMQLTECWIGKSQIVWAQILGFEYCGHHK